MKYKMSAHPRSRGEHTGTSGGTARPAGSSPLARGTPIVETINSADDLKIYTSGATNIFKYPELSDSTKASELIYALEEKQSLSDLVVDDDAAGQESDGSSNHGIQVYIGNETPVESMKDCSVVTATYELQDGMKGTIGIIGPKRMDYEKVVETLKNMRTQLDDVFKKS